MTDFNIAYKPHVYLAKQSKKKKAGYFLSVSIPVREAAIKSFKKEGYNPDKKYMKDRHKDCDIYVVTVLTMEIESKKPLKVQAMPPLQFIGLTAKIGRSKDKIAVIVNVESAGDNGHNKDAIHAYDDASEPVIKG